MEWYYEITDDFSVPFVHDGKTYSRAGQVFETTDACVMQRFLAEYRQQTGKAPVSKRQEIQDLLDKLCPLSQAGVNLGGAPHDAPVENPSGTGTDSAPAKSQETPASLGAPQPLTSGVLDATTPDPVLEDPRTPAVSARDQVAPVPPEQLADRFRADGTSDAGVDERLERARRGDADSDDAPHPFRAADESTDAPVSAEPVALFTGEYILEAVDLEIPGRGLDFRLVRRYASGRPYFGPWGFNWDHSYNVFLRELADGSVAIWTGRLREEIYPLAPNGDFESPTGVTTQLTRRVSVSGVTTGFILAHRDGVEWTFERPSDWRDTSRWPLIRIADRHGNALRLEYDAEHLLTRVVDTLGRTVRFLYGRCQLLERIEDEAGRYVEYWHASDVEHLIRVTAPGKAPGEKAASASYEYEDAGLHPALRHNIVRVLDAAERVIVENQYGAQPNTDSFNRVVLQYFEGNEFGYHYERLRMLADPGPDSINDAWLRVEYRAPCNPVRIYTFNFRGNLLDERVRLVADGSMRIWAMSYRYNKHGDVVEVRQPNGLGSTYEYDEDAANPRARSNLLKVIRRAPPTAFLVSRTVCRFTYEPRYQQVGTATNEARATTRYVYDYQIHPLGEGTGTLARIEHPDATLPDGTVQACREEFTCDATGHLTEWLTGEGRRFTYDYGVTGHDRGRLVRVTAGAGVENYTQEFSYDAFGLLSAVRRGGRLVAESEHGPHGELLRVRRSIAMGERAEIQYTYAGDGRLLEQRTPRGMYEDDVITDRFIRHTYDLDPLKHWQSVTYGVNTAGPRTWRFERDSSGNLLTTVDPIGRVTRMERDERGLVLLERRLSGTPDERIERFTYDRNGNLSSRRDPAGRETRFRYDAWDRLVEETLPGGTQVFFRYGADDRVERVEIVGAPGPGQPATVLVSRGFEHDERGRMFRETQASRVTTIFYDCDENPTRMVNERGLVTSYEHDALGNPTLIVDPTGNERICGYDAAGNAQRFEDRESRPGGRTLRVARVEYDDRFRPVRVIDSAGNTLVAEFDDRDMLVASTYPLGRRQELDRDIDGLIVAARSLALGTLIRHRWTRDGAGRVLTYTDPAGREINYAYEGDDRWTEIRFVDGSSRSRRFDRAGDLLVEDGADGSRVRYEYDAAGFIEWIRIASGPGLMPVPDTRFERDGMGNPVRITQAGAALQWTYDALGRLTTETWSGRSGSWSFDDALGRGDLQYPDGRIDRYTFDGVERVSSITLLQRSAVPLTGPALPTGTALLTCEYEGADRNHRRVYANGCQTLWSYDAASRLGGILHSAPVGVISSVRYICDAAGQRRVQVGDPAPDAAARFLFDDLFRLRRAEVGFAAPPLPASVAQTSLDAYIAAAAAPVAVRSYEYEIDDADTRTLDRASDTTGQSSRTYGVNALHQIVQVTSTSAAGTTTMPFAFDQDGRRTRDDRYSYTYDALGRPREIWNAARTTRLLTLEYDPVGRLSRRVDQFGTSESYRYLGPWCIQSDGPGGAPARQRTFVRRFDDPVLESSGTPRWLHFDARQSLLAVTDQTGSVLERYSYDPYGGSRIWAPDGITSRAASTVGLEPRFGGFGTLLGPDLYHSRARTYDASTGCFLQRDPRGNGDSANLYAYVGHDPIDLIDPSGEIAPIVAGLIIAGAAGGAGFSFLDANDHPERYQGNFSFRAMFNVYSGAAIGAVSGLAAQAVAAMAGVGAAGAGGGAAGAGMLGGTSLTITQKFVLGGTMTAVSNFILRSGFHGLFPERIQPPSVGSLAFDFATGGALGPLSLARPNALLVDTTRATFAPQAFGNTWRFLARDGFQEVRRWVLDRGNKQLLRSFEAVSQQWWRISGGARGKALHHWLIRNNTSWPFPVGRTLFERFKMSRLNLMEITGHLNSGIMGGRALPEYGFRVAVMSVLGVTGYGSYLAADDVLNAPARSPDETPRERVPDQKAPGSVRGRNDDEDVGAPDASGTGKVPSTDT